ncbi:MAG: 3-oxoacyl-[acyl-carrier-protein] reductase [Spirochaetales bacterium]|nr:3-oxoacyl-[acyl-carrier-protein] reductase [Spirochaetales bacterium]
MLLEGKKALVTGGSRGIGKEIVTRFLSEGADVWFVSTKESPHAGEIQDLAASVGRKAVWKQGDVGDEDSVSSVVSEVLEEAGRLDILVNNAGITRDGLIFRMSREDWERVMKINLESAFFFCRPIARQMVKQKGGSIINISSVVGVHGNGGQCNYSASKAGLIGLTKSLAKEIASRGVRVNALAPGFIGTAMTEALSEEVKAKLLESIPLGRIGDPKDVADAAVFLGSDLSGYITGQVLGIDGGMGA